MVLYVYAAVASVVKSDTLPPNLQSLKGMAIVERLLGVTMLSQALTPRRNPHVFRHQGKPLSGSH